MLGGHRNVRWSMWGNFYLKGKALPFIRRIHLGIRLVLLQHPAVKLVKVILVRGFNGLWDSGYWIITERWIIAGESFKDLADDYLYGICFNIFLFTVQGIMGQAVLPVLEVTFQLMAADSHLNHSYHFKSIADDNCKGFKAAGLLDLWHFGKDFLSVCKQMAWSPIKGLRWRINYSLD